MTEQQLDNMLKIKHLKELLKAKEEEYEIFGRTNEDIRDDAKIKQEINMLEKELGL